jgi:hypothetical protein
MRRLLGVPIVSKVSRWGVQQEAVYLEYSQERLASHAVDPWRIKDALSARNVSESGGVIEFSGQNIVIDPSGRFTSEKELGRIMVEASGSGSGAYLSDLVDMERCYRTPPENLNYFMYKDKDGSWRRAWGITLAVNMRHGHKIDEFSEQVDEALAEVAARLPEDLIMARTSDQPRQVEENVELFMEALGDAVWLVVLVSFIGFWEWRSALLMALSIPITLAMTFGMMHLMHLDLQQVSIASLILALGLLVDDPVVANDAIKRDLALGHPRGHRGLARAHQAGPGHPLRHHHQLHRLPALPVAQRRHRPLPLRHARGHRRVAGGLAPGLHDLHPLSRPLSAQTFHYAAAVRRGAPHQGVLRLLLPAGGFSHRPSLLGAGPVACARGRRLLPPDQAQAPVLPQRPVLSLLRGRLAARGRPYRDHGPRGQTGRGRHPGHHGGL